METQETPVATVETPKKRLGRPRKARVEVNKSSLPKAMTGEALERFVYKSNDAEMDEWEGNEEVSPMHVPKEIREAYPEMEFRFTSKYRLNKYGANYHGWQPFSDAKHPDGINRGNDMFLTCMPKERAQRYRDKVSERSIEAIRSQQSQALNFSLGQGLSKEEMDKILKDKGIDAKGVEAGIIVGVRPRTERTIAGRRVVSGGYTRGMSRGEAREIVRKEIENRKKNRAYSFPSR